MGKRLPKHHLLTEIVQQRTALDRVLAVVLERLMTKRGVTRGVGQSRTCLGTSSSGSR